MILNIDQIKHKTLWTVIVKIYHPKGKFQFSHMQMFDNLLLKNVLNDIDFFSKHDVLVSIKLMLNYRVFINIQILDIYI